MADPVDAAASAGQHEPGEEFPSAAMPNEGQKVELDLDDAPFLEDEKEEEEKKAAPPPEPVFSPTVPQEASPSFFVRYKMPLIIGGLVVAVMLVAGIVLKIVLSPAEQVVVEQPPQPDLQPLPEGPAPLPPAPVPRFVASFDTFWIARKDNEGNTRVLTCRFAVPTENQTLHAEIENKKNILRDAIFYYLSHRPITLLSDEATTDAFKADLMTVINEHLGNGKINELDLQAYIIR